MKNNFISNSTFLEERPFFYWCNLAQQEVKYEKINKDIVVICNYISAPRIAYCYYEEEFIFDLGNEAILDFVNRHFPNDVVQEVNEEPYSLFKESVKKDYKIKHIQFIENWSKVIIHPDGSFEKTDYPLKPYSTPLKESYYLVHNLLIKYKKIIENLLKLGQFIPTITGGVDTRCLTALYRDKIKEYNINTFYIKEIKNDGKNREGLSQADLDSAIKVANYLGIKNHTEDKSKKFTVSGMYTEANRGMYNMNINDVRFIYKFIQHQIRGVWMVYPFADDLFLQIEQPNKDVFRCLLALLLCPDLLGIELIGTQETFEKHNKQPYYFFDEYRKAIEEAQEIIEYWGEEKCRKILEE